MRDFLRHSVQVDFVIGLREQSVLTELLHAGSLPHIRHQLFDAVNTVNIPLDEGIQEFRCRVFCHMRGIVLSFRIIPRFRNSSYADGNQIFLFFRSRFVRQFFNAFPRSHIFDQLAGIGFGRILDISAGENDLRHGYSPRCQS